MSIATAFAETEASAPARSNNAIHEPPGHHIPDCAARLGPLKPLRFAPTLRAGGLDRTSAAPKGRHLCDGPRILTELTESTPMPFTLKGGTQ